MMIAEVRALVLLLMVGCIPNFQIDTLTFADSGVADAVQIDDASAPDTASDGGDDVTDGGIHPDADPPDVDTPDMGPPVEDCTNGDDDDMDTAIDCEDLDDCDLFVGSGWQCRNGVRAETECGNNLDDDGNESFDCHDPDCGCTAGVLLCCPNGMCLNLGDLCSG